MKHLITLLALLVFSNVLTYSKDAEYFTNGEILTTDTVVAINLDENIQDQTRDLSFNYKDTHEWHKYKVLRAIGWSCLGASLPLGIVGIDMMFRSIFTLDDGRAKAGAIIATVGAAMELASIPILIVAYHNRHKAKNMNLNLGLSTLNLPYQFTNDVPALSISFDF